jgi:uncharacterized protein YjbI with pentapeptide repeats
MIEGGRPPGYEPPTSAEELLSRYAAGERFFSGADIPDGACFSGGVLKGAVLEDAWLSCADFRGADLQEVSFRRSNVKMSNFTDADLRGASFQDASVEAAEFTSAKLDGVSFEGAGYYGFTIHDGDGFPN